MSKHTQLITNRVERERHAHEVNDVLARSKALKDRFTHVQLTPAYLEMERKQSELIGSMSGADVLDYGCGHGEMSLAYLAAGARMVHGIDISRPYVDEAANRCSTAGYPSERWAFKVMDAHALEYPNECFDWVIGRGILHHLHLHTAVAEIKRVLRSEGTAVFLEPLADNPLLRLFRYLTPRARTTDERPLTRADISLISDGMQCETLFFGMLTAPAAMLTSILIPHYSKNPILGLAHVIEREFRRRHWLDHYHQYALLILRKD